MNNSDAGMANAGLIFDIEFAYKLGGSKFGLAAMIRSQANPVDAQAIAEEFANRSPGVLWTVESKPWSAGGILAGGFGSFPVSDKVSFAAKAMIGFASASSPDMTINISGSGGSAWVKQSSVTATSFAFLIGTGFTFELSKRLCLLTHVDYFHTTPEFRNIEIVSSVGERSRTTSSITMQTVNLSIGLGIKI
jgi:hypothetical protein